MADSPFDASWYRVAALKPALRSHVQLHRHHYRGQLWYVLEDATTGRFHRFSPSAYELIGLMDGRRTVAGIWHAACTRQGDDAPTQGEVIALLTRLHGAEALLCDIPPDAEELLWRYQRQRRQKWTQTLRSPLAVRVPLLDPERFLERVAPLVRWAFAWPGAVLWLLVMTVGVTLAALHWGELTGNASDQILAPQNLLLIWLMFPLVKSLHELGHAFAVKAWGGEVHQMGIMFLVFTPVPYVDASAASAFRSKRRRMVVGAAGMLVELFVAALAMMAWVYVEPGVVRALLFNVMLIAGVSTLLFNGNPLLRFDGYYILADAIEIPNLASRANRYLQHLAERYLFGVKESTSPVTASGEGAWFVGYALASFVYRLFLYVGIAVFVASQFFFVGVALALWASFTMLVQPVGKGLAYLLWGSRVRQRRQRALAVTGVLVGALVAAVVLVPVPLATRAEGVVWVPRHALVRTATEGFVEEVLAPAGSTVRQGQALVRLADPLLRSKVRVLELEIEALRAQHKLYLHSDRVQAQVVDEQLKGVRAELARARTRLAGLTLSAPADGVFVLPRHDDLPGRYVRQGEELGFVTEDGPVSVRVVVGQDDIDLVRRRTTAVDVRYVERVREVVPATLKRQVPAAMDALPSVALGTQGGGSVAVDPRDGSGKKTLNTVFQLELELPAASRGPGVGSRVLVRFAHGDEPLAGRWYRAVRRLFLSEFDV